MIIRPYHHMYDDPQATGAILSHSVSDPESGGISALLQNYEEQEDRDLFLGSDNGVVLGVIGIHYLPDGGGKIRHLSIVPEHRKKGNGRKIIELTMTEYGMIELSADSPESLTDFFTKCGFQKAEKGFYIKKSS